MFTGRPAKLFEENNIDWAPNIKLGHIEEILENVRSLGSYGEKFVARILHPQDHRKRDADEDQNTGSKKFRLDRSESRDGCSTSDKSLLQSTTPLLDGSVTGVGVFNMPCSSLNARDPLASGIDDDGEAIIVEVDVQISEGDRMEMAVQTELLGSELTQSVSENANLKSQNADLVAKNNRLEIDNTLLRDELMKIKADFKKITLCKEDLENNDLKVKFYTGLPTFALLMHIFNLVECKVNTSHRNALPKFSEFLLVLIRLRLGLLEQDLAYRFNISQSTVNGVCDKWLPVMSASLNKLLVWPERDALLKTMPLCFNEAFGTRVAVIINCLEVLVDRGNTLLSKSREKHHKTVNFIIGSTHQGAICFISSALEGYTADQCIVGNCDFLNKLSVGDVVLTDPNVPVSDENGFYKAKLEIPTYTKGKCQLPCETVNQTKTIGKVRFHVEEMKCRLRRKFRILERIMPVSYLSPRTEGEAPHIDHIVKVCCALANFCLPNSEPSTDGNVKFVKMSKVI